MNIDRINHCTPKIDFKKSEENTENDFSLTHSFAASSPVTVAVLKITHDYDG